MRPLRILLGNPANTYIEVEGLNIFIGSNGAGKTRILSSIHKLFARANSSDWDLNLRPGSVGKSPVHNSTSNKDEGLIFESPTKSIHSGMFNRFGTEAFFDARPLIQEGDAGHESEKQNLVDSQKILLDLLSKSPTIENLGVVIDFKDVAGLINNIQLAIDMNESGELLHSSKILECEEFLRPLFNLLAMTKAEKFEDNSVLLKMLSRNFIYVAFNSSGAGTLMSRLNRSEVSKFEELVMCEPQYLENTLEPVGQFKGINRIELPFERRRNADLKLFFDASLETTSLITEIEGLYQFDDDVLIPILKVNELERVSKSMVSTFISDSTQEIFIDIDRMVLEYAASIAEGITETFYQPMVDWVYKRGIDQKIDSLGSEFFKVEDQSRSRNYIIHPAVWLACEFISSQVNKNLPSFISSKYKFMITPNGPDYWGWKNSGKVQCRIMKIDLKDEEIGQSGTSLLMNLANAMWLGPSEQELDIESLGAGMRRWINISISLFKDSANLLRVNTDTLKAYFELNFGSNREEILEDWDDKEYFWALWTYFCETDGAGDLVSFDDFEDSRFLIIDEPEANLHPEAIESVRNWLTDQAVNYGSVFVATHNLKIFDSSFFSTNRFTVKNLGSDSSQVTKIEVDPSYLDSWSHDLGLTTGEVFLATKRWLVVEGEVDKVVLERLFGSLLRDRGVRILPARGSSNMDMLLQLDFLRGIGGKVSVLLDADSPDGWKINKESLRTKIERGFFKKSIESSASIIDERTKPGGVLLDVDAHEQIDMMFYLDPISINYVLSHGSNFTKSGQKRSFDSWQSAWELFNSRVSKGTIIDNSGKQAKLTVTDFKDFLRSEFGLNINPWFANEVAKHQARRGIVPTGLSSLIDKITSPFYGTPLKINK
jgi:energy-coupling factor transporter ATP-binding protein EcfA2